MKYSVDQLEQKAHQYRRRFLEIFTSLGYGHLTSAFSWAEIATVLYHEIMDPVPSLENSEASDKIVVSKGHGVGILFPIFEDLGFFEPEELEEKLRVGGSSQKLRKLFYPGFDFYGGSLGIGLGLASGMAKGAKMSKKDWRVYCILGDAECYEGSVWEAMNFAGHNELDHLVAIVDRNQLGCSDFTEHMLKMEPFADKWRSCNWEVYEVDGHNVKEVYEALAETRQGGHEKPQCIIAHTQKGHGLQYLVDKPLMHGYMPKGEDIEKAFSHLR